MPLVHSSAPLETTTPQCRGLHVNFPVFDPLGGGSGGSGGERESQGLIFLSTDAAFGAATNAVHPEDDGDEDNHSSIIGPMPDIVSIAAAAVSNSGGFQTQPSALAQTTASGHMEEHLHHHHHPQQQYGPENNRYHAFSHQHPPALDDSKEQVKESNLIIEKGDSENGRN